MTKPRLALAGGFNGNGGGGDKPSRLDRLMERMEARGRAGGFHPIFALHYHEDYFHDYPYIDLKVEACKAFLTSMPLNGLASPRAAGLLMVMDDYPDGYLAKALEDLEIEDFNFWLDDRTIKSVVHSFPTKKL
jgi:hypothetical protein